MRTVMLVLSLPFLLVSYAFLKIGKGTGFVFFLLSYAFLKLGKFIGPLPRRLP